MCRSILDHLWAFQNSALTLFSIEQRQFSQGTVHFTRAPLMCTVYLSKTPILIDVRISKTGPTWLNCHLLGR